jgi:four helix bundle suffix protein
LGYRPEVGRKRKNTDEHGQTRTDTDRRKKRSTTRYGEIGSSGFRSVIVRDRPCPSVFSCRRQLAGLLATWIHDLHGQTKPPGPIGQPERSNRSKRSNLSNDLAPPKRSNYPELAANATLVLINVASTLLGRQVDSLAKAFEKEGGFTERLYRTRKARRGDGWQ